MANKYVNRGGFWIKHRKNSDEQFLTGNFNAECPNCHHEFNIPLVSFENVKKQGNQPDWIISKDTQNRDKNGN